MTSPKTALLNTLITIATGTASDSSVDARLLKILVTGGYVKRRGNSLKLTARGMKLLPAPDMSEVI